MPIETQTLTDEQLATVWKHVGLDVPADLVTETVRRRAAIVPYLGAMLVDEGLWASPDEGGWAPIHAIFLLSAIGSPEAAPYVAEFLRRDLGETWTTEEGQFLVFSLGPAGLDRIWQVIDDDDADEWGRVVAVEGASWIGMADESARPGLVARLRAKLGELLGKPEEAFTSHDETLLTQLCYELASLHDEASAADIRRAFEERRCDQRFTSLEEVESHFEIPFEQSLRRARRDPLDHFGAEELQRLQRIADESKDRDESAEPIGRSDDLDVFEGAAPLVAPPKVGRNDPCSCGSGKKFKRCCLLDR